jgi:hypothetical protein
MSTLYVMERHDQLLHVWRELNLMNLSVAHLDFHCDMRGLLVDQGAGRAYRTRDGSPELDEGNFITHAILEGRVGRIRWIHDVPGGRRDDVNGIKLTSDLTARWTWRRLKPRDEPSAPLIYEALTFSEWIDLEPGEFLDIDWDVFACKDYPAGDHQQRLEVFRQRKFSHTPKYVALCYSSDYSHDTRDEFERFIVYLCNLFNSRIVRLPMPPPRSLPTSFFKTGIFRPLYRAIRKAYFQGLRWLRYRGIY